tara:strand:+ start:367 stop:579 length:213 start_codon:yes stop_codon:yes gene_type:complete
MKDVIFKLKQYTLGTASYSGYESSGVSIDDDVSDFSIDSSLTIIVSSKFTGDIPRQGTAEEIIKHFQIYV